MINGMTGDEKLVLASGSPRRRELLEQAGIAFELAAVAVDETPFPDEPAADYVERLARAKSQAGAATCEPGRLVLGADTAVVADGRILGKPVDAADGRAMIARLSGRSHQVMTAIALTRGKRTRSIVQTSDVIFDDLDEAAIRNYIGSGEGRDKAGSYAVQGVAACFIREIRGSHSGIMGLPLFETAALLRQFSLQQESRL